MNSSFVLEYRDDTKINRQKSAFLGLVVQPSSMALHSWHSSSCMTGTVDCGLYQQWKNQQQAHFLGMAKLCLEVLALFLVVKGNFMKNTFAWPWCGRYKTRS
jgi:hypothetical protein